MEYSESKSSFADQLRQSWLSYSGVFSPDFVLCPGWISKEVCHTCTMLCCHEITWLHASLKIICSSRKYPYSPHGKFLFFTPPPPHPPGNSSLASYFASKILASKTPLPLEISNDLPWGEYGFFLELHKYLSLSLDVFSFVL